mmetsp:Transcript_29146/g.54566  ORF Transcript_29146/g.54566 Transcript_29146/m.54566 type:complete len:105 (-) Transcript_29146:89-403(-)
MFSIKTDFKIDNSTGVSEIRISINGPGESGAETSVSHNGYSPGGYSLTVSIDTTPQPDANPPVFWDDGPYAVTFGLCQGECFSSHPHSIVLDTKVGGNFTITGQ